MKRLSLLDLLRTIAIVNMVAFHLCYDLNVVSGRFVEWQFLPTTVLWQQFIVLSFIFVSGLSLAVRRSGQASVPSAFDLPKSGPSFPTDQSANTITGLMQHHKPLLQAMRLLLLGQVITWATVYFMPSEAIYYGVITFMGSALLIGYLLENPRYQLLSRVPALPGLIASLAVFCFTYHVQLGFFGFTPGSSLHQMLPLHYALPTWLYAQNFAFLGFPSDDFLSADYVSFIPHIFMYLAGFYAYKLLAQKAPQLLQLGDWAPCKILGGHSLLLYFVHQPVLLGLLWLFGLL